MNKVLKKFNFKELCDDELFCRTFFQETENINRLIRINYIDKWVQIKEFNKEKQITIESMYSFDLIFGIYLETLKGSDKE